MSPARAASLANLTPALKLLPSLFTAVTLLIAAGWVLVDVDADRPSRTRPAVRRSTPIVALAETSPLIVDNVHVVYIVDSLQRAYQVVREQEDSAAPGILAQSENPWAGSSTALTLASRRLTVLVVADVEARAAAERLLFDSSSEVFAAGGVVNIIDLR
ncbi:MAG TPA: hypothetical protein VJB57_21195 [Dehalococcoidia bacterium]|nr:hypothetical protein [Dehalococcoidia bacterium]